MKTVLLLASFALILAACGRASYTYDRPCTVNEIEGGALITCPDGTEIEIVPDVDEEIGDNCEVGESEDSYTIVCPDSVIDIPKFDDFLDHEHEDDSEDDDEEEDHSMRCKKNAEKKYKCQR